MILIYNCQCLIRMRRIYFLVEMILPTWWSFRPKVFLLKGKSDMTQTAQQMDKETVRARLQENPGVILEALARNSGFSMAELIELLPEEMWKWTDGSRFIEIMQMLSKLGKMTLVMNTPDVIMEFSGDIPSGSESNGFYNLDVKSPMHGHVRAGNCKSVYLVERPFMKSQTLSIQFMNEAGEVMFKVFAGRDEKRELIAEQVKALRSIFQDASVGVTA